MHEAQSAPAFPCAAPQSGIVRGVIDGDTLKVELLFEHPCYYSADKDSGWVNVRLLGVDTPESDLDGNQENLDDDHWRFAVQQKGVELTDKRALGCHGPAVHFLLNELALLDREVMLCGDPGEPDTDRYLRPLRWVFLDGQNLSELLVAHGLAVPYDATSCTVCVHCDELAAALEQADGCLWE